MNLIHENYWKYFKGNVLQEQREIRKQPVDKIKSKQWERLKKLLDYVYINNEFYKSFFDSSDISPKDIKSPKDLLLLPTTEKQLYKKYFNKILTKNNNENEYDLSSTSGSTGEPFKFYVDKKREGPNMYAAFTLNKEAMGIKPFKKRNVLEIKASPRNEIKNFKQKLHKNKKDKFRKLYHSEIIGLSAHTIKQENIIDIINIIKEKNIRAINGYSTSILLLAGLLSEQDISFNVDYIITIGEGLLEQQREYISHVFNCPVYRDYIASECIHMGSECKFQNGYHMDIYNYYFEFLKDGRCANENETGEIVVTNLNNYVFPFIRYKIGDSARLTSSPCQCNNNLPLVKDIFGRSTDIIKTPTGKEVSSAFISVPFRYLHEFVKQYQLIQVNSNKIIVKIVPTNSLNDKELNKIHNTLDKVMDNSMKINIELVKDIDAGASGKRKVIITKKEYQRLQGGAVS